MESTGRLACSCAIPTDIDQCKKLFNDDTLGANLDILTIVATLWPLGESQVQHWFADRGFTFNPPMGVIDNVDLEHFVFQIMYKQDKVTTIDWNPIWARQCRGVILLVSDESQEVRVLRYLLQRGEEISTPQHFTKNSNDHHRLLPPTEVVACHTKAKLRLLDKRQRETIQQLQQGGQINGELTMKVDGMLVAWTFYSGNTINVMKDAVQNAVDNVASTFGNALLDACQNNGRQYIAVLSTQKTLLISDVRTQAYVVTAILSSLGFHDELCQILKKNSSTTPAEVINVFATRIVDRMDGFFLPNGSSSQSICLEAVCGQNDDGLSSCAWGVTHDEFALSYKDSFVSVLGRAEGLSFQPHFHFSDRIRSLGFIEPLWWKVSHVNQIQSLLQQLTDVAMGEKTRYEFLAANPPINLTMIENQVEHQVISSEDLLHLEGFVFYGIAGGNRHYNKIKLPLYYILHSGHNETRTKEEHVQLLVKVGRNNPRISANAREAADFFAVLEEKLGLLYLHLKAEFNLPLEENVFYQSLKDAQQSAVRRKWKDPVRRWEAWRIMIHSHDIQPLLDSFITQFPALQRTKVKVKHLAMVLRSLTYGIKPWESNYLETISQMVASFHPQVLKFYAALKWTAKESKENAKILSYFRVGCPESTDIDVMVQLDSLLDVERVSRDEIDLRKKLSSISDISYDLLDINYFYVNCKIGRAQMFSKGSRIMSSNILFSTYGLHRQHFPLPIIKPEPVDINELVRGLFVFILREVKILISAEAYLEIRSRRIGTFAVKGGSMRRDFVLSVMPQIQEYDSIFSRDAIKSFTMKSIQILCVLYLHTCPFVKDEMAKCFEVLFPGHGEHARFHLFRGRQGLHSPTFLPFLKAKVIVAIHLLDKNYFTHWHNLAGKFHINPSIALPDALHTTFWEDPIDPTEEFSMLFQTNGGASSLRQWFQLGSCNLDALPQNAITVLNDDQDIELLNDIVGPVVFACPQRSDAWFKIREQFPNSSTGNAPLRMDPTDPTAGFNLFRGCLVEMSITGNADFSTISDLDGYELVQVGCIVDSSRTTNQSPDFLMVNKLTNQILPGEIKCSPTPFRDNANLRRTLQQSRQQLRGVADMLDLKESTTTVKGVLILVNIYKRDGKPHMECRLTLLNLSS